MIGTIEALEAPVICAAAVATPAAAATVMVTPTDAEVEDPGSIPNGPVGMAAVALALIPVAHEVAAFWDAAIAI